MLKFAMVQSQLLMVLSMDAFRKHIEKHSIANRLNIINVEELEPNILRSRITKT